VERENSPLAEIKTILKRIPGFQSIASGRQAVENALNWEN